MCLDRCCEKLCASQAALCTGCYAFAHSGGGQLALAAEAKCPGTFAAIYAFEPVLSLPASMQWCMTLFCQHTRASLLDSIVSCGKRSLVSLHATCRLMHTVCACKPHGGLFVSTHEQPQLQLRHWKLDIKTCTYAVLITTHLHRFVLTCLPCSLAGIHRAIESVSSHLSSYAQWFGNGKL